MKHRERELLFRELVIGFLGGNGDGKSAETPEQKYCRACKAAKKNKDCDKCSMAHGA